MLRQRTAILLCLLFFSLMVTPVRAGELQPRAVIQTFYETLLQVMKEGPRLGFAGRTARLAPAIGQAYNLPLMARLSVGPQWQGLTAEAGQAITKAFVDYTVATYASRFDDYSGETFEVLPETPPAGGGVIVETRILRSGADPVSLNYLMRQSGAGWRIVDVFLNGTVSELATRRSEFTSVLRRDGPQALVRLLEQRVQKLKGS